MGYRTMTREDAAIIQQQQISTTGAVPVLNTPTSQSNQNLQQQSSPTPQGHHRTSRQYNFVHIIVSYYNYKLSLK